MAGSRHDDDDDDDYGYGSRNGRSSHDRDRGDDFSNKDLTKLANDAFSKSAKALSKADYGKTTKFLGVFDVDTGLAAYLSTMYNVAADYGSKYLEPKTYDLTLAAAKKLGVSGGTQKELAAAATILGTVLLKTGGYITPILDEHKKQRKERIELAHSLAPVLDDLKGTHSLNALNSVSEANNEVIFAHRKRIARINSTHNVNNLLDVAILSGSNLLLDLTRFSKIWSTKERVTDMQLKIMEKQQRKAEEDAALSGEFGNTAELRHLGRVLMNTTAGQVADRVKKSGEYKLNETLQPYSALEMILELSKQVATNPKSTSFQLPKSYQSPKTRPESYPLEEYVMRVLIQHQKDMADISPEHTEIREALKEDLMAVSKPIAKAIREGHLSALSLVRLVGEGHVIKNHGRAIAAPEDVEAVIEHDAAKQATLMHIDPKEFYQNSSYTRTVLKDVFSVLKGDERLYVASQLPDSVLEDIGFSKKDIADVHEQTKKGSAKESKEQVLAEAAMGLQEKSDDELQRAGLGKHQVKELRQAVKKIETKGMDAISELKSGPTNDHGLDRLVMDYAIPQISGQKEHFGTLMDAGRTKLADLLDGSSGGHTASTKKTSHHSRHDADLADISHAEREERRSHMRHEQHSHRD